jgi:hypothetical protein
VRTTVSVDSRDPACIRQAMNPLTIAASSTIKLTRLRFICALGLLVMAAQAQQSGSQIAKDRLTRTKVVRRFDSNENIR